MLLLYLSKVELLTGHSVSQSSTFEPLPRANAPILNKMNIQTKTKLFFFGVIAAFGALLIEMIASIIFPQETAFLYQQITFLLILFAVAEELFKFAMVWKAVSNFQNARDFFISAFLIGSGFALTEISLAIFSTPSGQNTSWTALLGIFIVHTSTCVLLSYAIFLKKRSLKLAPIPILLFLIILHLIYNIIVIYSTGSAIVIAYLFALSILAFAAAKKLLFH